MKIALLDSGVDCTHEKIDSNHIININTPLLQKNVKDTVGHGTAVAFLLQNQLKQASILSYKLFDEYNNADEMVIIQALEDIEANHDDVSVINMSCGITVVENYRRLYDVCNRLKEKGIFIVAAFDNNGRTSFPAAFDNTIGVYFDKQIVHASDFWYIDNQQINVLGFAGGQRLPWVDGQYKKVSGSSFVTPYITASVAKYCDEKRNISYKDVLRRLQGDAKRVLLLQEGDCKKREQEINREKVGRIKKAIIFPVNKETKSIIGNSDLIPFSVVGIYDHKFSKKTGKRTAEVVFGESIEDFTIATYDDIDWQDDFDTIIVGHLQKISAMYRKDFHDEILKKCIKYKKNCMMFDCLGNQSRELIQVLEEQGNYFISHKIEDLRVRTNPCGSYYKIPVPTIAIVGTSPRQGKFNIQLSLRRRFLREGYSVGQISSEPSGHLFGMDICLSTGFNNQYSCTSEDELLYINAEAFKLRERDIVVMGTQSQIIPYQFGNIGFMTWHQQNLMLAIEPDATVLCINIDDDISYIERCISVLKNYYETSVIALVIFPFPRQREWSVDNQANGIMRAGDIAVKKKELWNGFQIPCYVNGIKEDMDSLYEKCITYFSEGASI